MGIFLPREKTHEPTCNILQPLLYFLFRFISQFGCVLYQLVYELFARLRCSKSHGVQFLQILLFL